MQSENLAALLDPRCKEIAQWSVDFLELHREEATARLLRGRQSGEEKIMAGGGAVRTWNNLNGNTDLRRRFVEDYVYFPIQEEVSIISHPTSG